MEKLVKHENGQWSLASLEKGMGNTKSALGITSDKNKLHFDSGFGQSEYREYVEQRADHMSTTGYVAGTVDDFNWGYIPDYEVEKLVILKKDRATWSTWFNAEWIEWQYDQADYKKNHFQKWAQHPELKPIIVIQGLDDKPHIIDGHHRYATAIIKDFKTIPTIYGTRKSK